MLMNSILYASSSQGLKNAVMAQMAVALVASTVLPNVTGVRPAPRARAPRGGDGSDASLPGRMWRGPSFHPPRHPAWAGH